MGYDCGIAASLLVAYYTTCVPQTANTQRLVVLLHSRGTGRG